MEIFKILNHLDYFVIAAYLLVVVGLGAWVSRRQQHDENLFLAQHSLGWPSIGFSMWGTNVGPSMLIASAASGYTVGVAVANFSWYAFVFIGLLAFLFAPFYVVTKTSTLPEFIGRRFNESSRDLLAWYSLVTILVSWLGLTLYAGGLLASQITNWPLWLSVVALTVISAFFTLSGGLKTVANTNVFQMSLLIVASLILVIFAVAKAGGIAAIYAQVPADHWKLFLPAANQEFPWHAILLGYPVLGIWFWCTDQSMVQAVLGAKNLRQARLGTGFCAWLKVLDMFLFILPGIICVILFPTLKEPNDAYMTLVRELLPHGLIGLIMTVLVAALISTIASALNSLSTIFTLDIYQKRCRPNAGTEETIRIGRIVTFIGSAAGVGLALAIALLKDRLDLFSLFQAVLGFLAPPLSAVFIVGILWRRATAAAANTVLTLGTVISFTIGILFFLGWPSKEFWPHFMMLTFYLFTGLCALMVAVSLATRPAAPQAGALPSLRECYRLSGPVGVAPAVCWGTLVVVMAALYLFFD
jgi:SSS family solute:Na+ symporter